MKIDFHVHAKITSTFDFDANVIKEYVEEGKCEALDAFVLSEHCHAKDFNVAYEYIRNNYKKTDDCYICEGIKIFTGIEVTTEERFDVVVISNIEYIYKLKKEIDNILNVEQKKFISMEMLFNIINKEEAMIILAHPYRRFDIFPEIKEGILSKVDAVEINATDLYKFGVNEMKERIDKLSVQLNVNITEGSDAHNFMQIGSVRGVLNNDYTKISDIKKQIEKGNIEFEMSQNFRTKVKSARAIKKIICGKA